MAVTWDRLRRLSGLNQGRWVARGETIMRPDEENREPVTIARCDSLQTAEYIIALHEWTLRLANALILTSKRLEDSKRQDEPIELAPTVSPLRYPSELTNLEWDMIKPLVTMSKHSGRGRPCGTNFRLVINALLHMARTGCSWRELPEDYPPLQTVQMYLYRWRASGVFKKIAEIRQDLLRLGEENKYAKSE